ncbi:MAG TPA: polysaccharide deacetylase family protein [Acidimicrobiia bacterium]|nr:polysaccharide deacetylase family protein [Acidimicrobiia bacterium]
MRPSLVVSVHDVAPSTACAARTWVDELDRRHVPATLLVVPGPWEGPPLRLDQGLVAWLHDRRARGDEIAQHGWTHRPVAGAPAWRRAVASVAARGCAEFWSLDTREAKRRIELGRDVLDRAGFEPVGFTPPGWLASAPTLEVLAHLGYRYTTTRNAVFDLRAGTTHRVPALSQRPGGAAEAIGRTVVDGWARRLVRRGASVRLALHPLDLDNPALVASNLAVIDQFLEAGAKARTYQHFVTAHRTGAAGRAA